MKTSLAAATCVAVLMLLACAGYSHRLVADKDSDLTAGWFNHSRAGGAATVLEFGGKRFEARGFPIVRNQGLAELRRRYGADSRRYEGAFLGTDIDHSVDLAEPDLRAADGATMQYAVAWRTVGHPRGICMTPEGKQIDVRFE